MYKYVTHNNRVISGFIVGLVVGEMKNTSGVYQACSIGNSEARYIAAASQSRVFGVLGVKVGLAVGSLHKRKMRSGVIDRRREENL